MEVQKTKKQLRRERRNKYLGDLGKLMILPIVGLAFIVMVVIILKSDVQLLKPYEPYTDEELSEIETSLVKGFTKVTGLTEAKVVGYVGGSVYAVRVGEDNYRVVYSIPKKKVEKVEHVSTVLYE